MKRAELLFSVLLVPLDYLMLIAAGATAYGLRFHTSVAQWQPILYPLSWDKYISIMLLVSLTWLVLFALSGLYNVRGNRRLIEEIRRVFLACSTGVVLIIILFFFERHLFSSRFIILAGYGLSVLFVTTARVIVIYIERALFSRGIGVHRVALIGNTRISTILAQELTDKSSLGFQVVYQADNWTPAVQQEIIALHETGKLDEVIQTNPNIDRSEIEQLYEFCREHHLIFKYAAALFDTQATTDISIQPIAGIPIIELQKTKLEGWWRVLKRLCDIVGSLILIVCTSPIMLIVALGILLDSGRPIFFTRRDDGSRVQRVGQMGKLFFYFKFRTMRPGTDSLRYDPSLQAQNLRTGSPLVKLRDDPRVTRIGAWLRRFSLDEFPEFFLVLKGDMSLVGPRPHLPEEVARYQQHHKQVLYMKPGITGLSQISGRSDLEFEDEVRLDVFYMEHWSLWLDLVILIKTPFRLLQKRNAL